MKLLSSAISAHFLRSSVLSKGGGDESIIPLLSGITSRVRVGPLGAGRVCFESILTRGVGLCRACPISRCKEGSTGMKGSALLQALHGLKIDEGQHCVKVGDLCLGFGVNSKSIT